MPPISLHNHKARSSCGISRFGMSLLATNATSETMWALVIAPGSNCWFTDLDKQPIEPMDSSYEDPRYPHKSPYQLEWCRKGRAQILVKMNEVHLHFLYKGNEWMANLYHSFALAKYGDNHSVVCCGVMTWIGNDVYKNGHCATCNIDEKTSDYQLYNLSPN